MSSTNPPIAARDFTDAGTERFFAADKPIDADDGTIANYRAAGLIKEDEALSSKKPTDKSQGDKPA